MNGRVQIVLALILFLPWFSILGYLFWRFPRQPRTRGRIGFDLGSLLLATGLAAWGMQWGFFSADPSYGGMWKQILATSVSYGLFLLALTVAVLIRMRVFPSGKRESPLHSRIPGTHHQ